MNRTKQTFRIPLWCGLAILIAVGASGCGGGDEANTTAPAASAGSNTAGSSAASATPTTNPNGAPVRARPAGVPPDRPRFPGEPAKP